MTKKMMRMKKLHSEAIDLVSTCMLCRFVSLPHCVLKKDPVIIDCNSRSPGSVHVVRHILSMVGNSSIVWWPVVLGIFLPKIIQIW